ncbi:MAG: hypothetical protein WCT01_00650 [Candidatus Shapirobacteria bacterium]
MNKRAKFLFLTLIQALGFLLFVELPYDSRLYGVFTGLALTVFSTWYGLGLIYYSDWKSRLAAIILPIMWFFGLAMFISVLELPWWWDIPILLLFGGVNYTIYLIENVFMVAVGYKTVPLYRAAFTVSVVVTLFASFLVYDVIFSYRLGFWQNMLIFLAVTPFIFTYIVWSVLIELPDDGKDLPIMSYVLASVWMMSQMAMVLSFWPTGVFKSSLYMVSFQYILISLIQLTIRERLFKKSIMSLGWILVAVIISLIVTVSW